MEGKMNKTLSRLLLTVIFLAAVAGYGQAEEMAAVPAPAEMEMTPEQKMMMANMEAYTTPNEHHDVLKTLEGNWQAEVKFWMDPAQEPQTSTGTSNATMIFGGRFLEQTYTGMMMDQPFEGRGILGYDNIQKEFQGIWIDSMGTGIMKSTGQYDEATKTIAEKGSM